MGNLNRNIVKFIGMWYYNAERQEVSSLNNAYLSEFHERQETLPAGFDIFHRTDTHPSRFLLHSHDFYEIFFMLSGGMDAIAGGRRYALVPGSILLLSPGELHRPCLLAEPDQPYERIVLWLSPRLFADQDPLFAGLQKAVFGKHAHLLPNEAAAGDLRALLTSLLREKDSSSPDAGANARETLAQLLRRLKRCLEEGTSVRPAAEDLRKSTEMAVYQCIEKHWTRDISVFTLARQFHIDPNALTRQFHWLTGLTPGDYIRKKRLSGAYRMIAGGMRMQEACQASGFRDYSAFYRAFRQAYGLSPRAFSRECAAKGAGQEEPCPSK